MGGFGSGRPSGTGRSTVEACRSIDVNRLNREGCLHPGWSGIWQWTQDGEQVAWVQLRAEQQRLEIKYRVRVSGGDWTDIDEAVQIVRAPCRLGGGRPYLICPGVVNGRACNRRVVKLYGAGRYFLCRHCHRLAYASQSEDGLDRIRRRSNKIRGRLGGQPGFLSPFPTKPKGMWNRTYERLRDSAVNAEIQAEGMFEIKAGHLMARLNGHSKGSFWS